MRRYSNPSRWKTRLDTPCPLLMPCASCRQLKLVTEFYLIKNQQRKDMLGNFRQSTCKDCNLGRYISKDVREKLLLGAKARAKERQIEFDLVIEDIFVPEICPVLGVELFQSVGRGKEKGFQNMNAPTIDRVSNTEGYIRGNICIISRRANSIKGDASIAEMISLISYALSCQHNKSKSGEAIARRSRDFFKEKIQEILYLKRAQ
jgi:hypothetical protein